MTISDRKAEYQKLCDSGSITDLFMQPWWLDATGEWDVVLHIKNGKAVAAMPFGVKKRWGLTFLTMPPFTHHLSVWLSKPPDISEHKWLTREKQMIWSLLDELPRASFFSMVFEESGFKNWLPFYWKGYRQELRYTFKLFGHESSDHFENVNRNIRRSLRETENLVSIREGSNGDQFYTLAKQTYKRQKLSMPYSNDEFNKLHAAIQKNGSGRIFEAFENDQIAAVAYLVWDSKRAYYLLAGNSETGMASKAGFAVCAEAIRFAFDDLKVDEFDFCGSMIESITEVRRQFGATSVPLMKIYKANSKWLDILYTLTR